MNPYFDLGFLLTLLVKAPGTRLAEATMRRFQPPFRLNLLHQLQVENGLSARLRSHEPAGQRAGASGQTRWLHYLEEGVFNVTSDTWESALHLAITWQRQTTVTQPAPGLMLHAALAVAGGATHFLSFDQRVRRLAAPAGVKLLPENL